MAAPPQALMALARGLPGLRPRRRDTLRRARPLADPGPIRFNAEADQLMVPPVRPRLCEVRSARDVRDTGFACLGSPEPRAGRWTSLGRGRDLAHHHGPPIRDVRADLLTVSDRAVPSF